MHLAQNAKIGGHFGYFKTLSRLKDVYWKHKNRDVNKYVQGWKMNHQRKKFGESAPFEVSNR